MPSKFLSQLKLNSGIKKAMASKEDLPHEIVRRVGQYIMPYLASCSELESQIFAHGVSTIWRREHEFNPSFDRLFKEPWLVDKSTCFSTIISWDEAMRHRYEENLESGQTGNNREVIFAQAAWIVTLGAVYFLEAHKSSFAVWERIKAIRDDFPKMAFPFDIDDFFQGVNASVKIYAPWRLTQQEKEPTSLPAQTAPVNKTESAFSSCLLSKEDFFRALGADSSIHDDFKQSISRDWDNAVSLAREVRASLPGIGFISTAKRLNCFVAACRHIDSIRQMRIVTNGEAILALNILRIADRPFRKAITMFDIRGPQMSLRAQCELPDTACEYLQTIKAGRW